MIRRNTTSEEKICVLCNKLIEPNAVMLDLFRGVQSVAVMWCHLICARTAVERWLQKKIEKKLKET
jgi:hypothetical protein